MWPKRKNKREHVGESAVWKRSHSVVSYQIKHFVHRCLSVVYIIVCEAFCTDGSEYACIGAGN